MYIGNVKIEGQVLLAPMAGVSDYTFRSLCKEFGAALVYSEMASSKALLMDNKKTKDILNIRDHERPVAIQIFGADEEVLKIATIEIQNQFSPDIIDINFGCPAQKIAGNGDGSALMKKPEQAAKIVKAVKSVSNAPVTVKFRLGWDEDSINAVEFGLLMVDSGADALTVHGRTRVQQYSGEARYEKIKELKEKTAVPVIVNGDINSGEKAKTILEYTSADAVMVGRGAYGNPWIFSEINSYLKNGTILSNPTVQEKMAIMLIHIEELCKNKGEKIGMRNARKHCGWYTKGIKNSASYRKEISTIETLDQIKNIVYRILSDTE